MSRIYCIFLRLLFGLSILALAGCVSMATDRLARNLSHAMLNQNDPEIVRTGAPAYLLLLDSLIEESPNDAQLLLAGANLYSAYAGGLIESHDRRLLLTERARSLADQGLCLRDQRLCDIATMPFETLTETLDRAQLGSLQATYIAAVSWAGWIQARSDDWDALADLGKVEALLEAVAAREPGYDRGRAQLYLGIIRTQLPTALGGRPEIGRRHFEAALDYSRQRDLMVKVEYARRYAGEKKG